MRPKCIVISEGEITPLGVLDHVDLADQVGDRHVGGGELLVVAVLAADPGDRGGIAHRGDFILGFFRERRERVVVDLGALDDRHGVVEEVDQLAEHPRLGLAAEAEQEHVVAGEDGVLDLGDDGLFVSQDVGEERLALADLGDQVPPHLVLDRLDPETAGSKLAESAWAIRRHRMSSPGGGSLPVMLVAGSSLVLVEQPADALAAVGSTGWPSRTAGRR